ncbi:MAG TPA: LCP family protein [Candidatus Galloscillospira excrementipullorum]|nr:LCP family protein [Candidatus Galloscillospira excrementipullorum]
MKKPKLSTVIIAALAVVFFAVGWYYAALSSAYEGVVEIEPPPSIDQHVSGWAYNLLLAGTDGGDFLTDTLMLVRVDLDNSSIALLSLMRDTRVRLGNSYGKLNAVYGRDGMEGLISCVKELTGAPVHYYALVDLEAFQIIVDELGGVDFDVPQDMNYSDATQNLYINLKAGMQHLDGEHAMELVRFRRYVEGDVQRTRVQQQFVKALLEQKFKAENLLKVPDIFNKLEGELKTNVTLADILDKAPALRLFQVEDAVQIYEMPGVGQYVGQVSYFLHEEDELYDLCEQHFGGSGEPEEKVYTDYSLAVQSAAPTQSGSRPAETSESSEPATAEGQDVPAQPSSGQQEEGAEPVVQQGGQPDAGGEQAVSEPAA